MIDFDENNTYDRDYQDNFSIRELATNKIMPKYFPEDTTHLTVGLEGMITEYIGTVTEDAFNAGSTLLMETFPTRAQFSSSIYSNASIFQLSNVFSAASSCEFIIILKEEDIRKNFIQTQNGKFRYFYIDKNTIFYVKEIPFSLDYDIKIKAKYIGEDLYTGKKKYAYSASYDLSEYKNSASTINMPYIKVRTSSNGNIALSVIMHQYIRDEREFDIDENSTINYPSADIRYDGKIAAIDVLYKGPDDSDFNTQLELRPIFSQPSTEPFCYYRKIDDEKIHISFTPKDGYFHPKFNSEIKVIIYETLGKEGNFPAYDGDDVVISKNTEKYQYEYSWALVAKPVTASTNGRDAINLEELRNLTIEGFSTANALTTSHDLSLYFNNFCLHYGGDCKVLFLKKRDDAVERLHSAFLYLKKDGYFYPTNTLNLYTNILKLDYHSMGYYHMCPGYLFEYKTEIVYYLPIRYHTVLDYSNYYMEDNHGHYFYYINGKLASPRISLNEEEITDMVKLEDLIPGNIQWYAIKEDHYELYDDNGLVEGDEASIKTEDEIFDMLLDDIVTFGRRSAGGEQIEFLTDIEKEAKHRKEYLLYKETWKANNNAKDDLTTAEYIFNYPYSQYERDFDIDPRVSIFDGNVEENVKNKDFVFTNPFLIQITKDTGLVGYYLTYVSQKATLDFCSQNDDDAFVQFIAYNIKIDRNIGKDKKYSIKLELLPSVSIETIADMVHENLLFNPGSTINDKDNNLVDQFLPAAEGYGAQKPSLQTYDKTLLNRNNLRVILSFFEKDTGDLHGYMEMIPTSFNRSNDHIIFESEFETDDFITTDNKFRATHRCPHCGNVVVASTNHNIDGNFYYCMTCGSYFKEGIINVKENDDILLPIIDAKIEVTVLYRSPMDGPYYPTDNKFAQYDSTYEGYRWTNVYSTLTEPITFIEPLNMLRGIIEYQDYYLTGVEALDCLLYDIPMLKYSLITYKDEGMVVTDPLLSDDVGKFYYFMTKFKESYDYLKKAKLTLRNSTNIDVKFYNTYGRSNNFIIGENKEFIDTNNITISFYVWVISNTDLISARNELKDYIKEYIESINSEGSNDLYISNLIKGIENTFAYVHHLKFIGINNYDSTYQSIINTAISLDDLSKEERRHFVPELLVVNKNNIKLIIQEAD